ncbi:Ribonuclease H1 [Yarrowia sp. B02]|nr:Ribonuclease H1 [Yarrowia sp. B02]
MAKTYNAVKVGRIPGVYTDYSEALQQTRGFSKNVQKRFKDYDDAKAFKEAKERAAKEKAPKEEAEAAARKAAAEEEAEKEKKRVRQRAYCEQLSAESNNRNSEFGVKLVLEEIAAAEKGVTKATAALESAKRELKGRLEDLREKTSELARADTTAIRYRNRTDAFYVAEKGVFLTSEDATNAAKGAAVSKFETFEDAMHQAKRNKPSTVPLSRELSYVNGDKQTVYQVFVDGACAGNGTADARSDVGVYFGACNPLNLSVPVPGKFGYPATNQRAELSAVLRGYFQILSQSKPNRLYEICTDSQYAINCLTGWAEKWRENGWKTDNGSAVRNQDEREDCCDLDTHTLE